MSCRSSPRTRARERGGHQIAGSIALALLVFGASVGGVRAQTPPDETLPQRAHDVLKAHCAACREIGVPRSSAESPATLDLAAIARDPNLVRPGNPDGSPAYTAMIRRLGTSRSSGSGAAPTPDELAALRTWIESLPPSASACAKAALITRSHVEPLLRRQARTLGKSMSALRVLTLAHLDAGCISAEQLASRREAVGLFLTALAGKRKPVPTYPLDPGGQLLAVDIQALGWDGDHWRVLTGAGVRATRSNEPLIVRADWLIVHVLRGELGARLANPSEPAPPKPPLGFHDPTIGAGDRAIARAMLATVAPEETAAHNAEAVLQLARAHLAPAGLARVAVELGVERAALERHMTAAAGGVKDLLLRLAHGTIPRDEIEEGWLLFARLGGAAPPVRTTVPVQFDAVRPGITPETPIDLALYADRVRYAPGDPVQLTIRPNLDCRLTVISIDTSGHGTVIFPNDFATNNLASAQLNLSLPAPGAGYRFRAKEKGRERVVALCTRTEGVVDGIHHDFERQRFQELGLYSAFLDAALRRRASSGEDRSDREKGQPLSQDQIWRTGIVIEVE